MFLGLTVTGVLLMFYYVPSVERAYQDIQALEANVRFGQLLRNMHRWMAHAMIILVLMHMMRVFYTGAYKPPREFNWVVGVVLFILTLLLSFTGYLLPWDQLASGQSPSGPRWSVPPRCLATNPNSSCLVVSPSGRTR